MDVLVMLEERPDQAALLAHVNSVPSPLTAEWPQREVVTVYGDASPESLALALAAAVGAYSQSRAVSAACDGISRNPGASPQIRFALLLGLVLIESLVIYVFVIALSIIFVKWGLA